MQKTRGEQNRKAPIYFLCFVFFTIIFIFGIYAFDTLTIQKDHVLQSEPAVFDCSEARPLEEVHRYYLTGDWQFFYRELIAASPTDAEPSAMLSVPSPWTGTAFARTPFQNGGCGSYRCYIEGVQTDRPLIIYVPNLTCAYRIYVDGELVTECGEVSAIQGGSKSSAAALKKKVYLDRGRHEIIAEVSSEFSAGLYLSPILADYAAESNYNGGFLALRYALIGIILYAALVLFIFGYLSKIRYFSPWLPALFTLLALRMLLSTEGYSVSQPWFFGISYEKMYWANILNTFLIKLIAIIYFRDELKLRVPNKSIIALSLGVCLFIALASLLPYTGHNGYYSVFLQSFSAVVDAYLINKLCIELAEGKKNAGLFCGAYIFLICGVAVDILYTGGVMPVRSSSFMPIAFTLFALFITIIHAKSIVTLYHRVQQTRALERELEKANMAVMISQIQPHFLYNALNTIKSLIRRDPKTAEKAVIDFSYYLRGNMDSLTRTEPIPFRTELEHIRYYCDIELLRFSDRLHIEYAIETDGFTVPTLSVQPLVENAIKHGVTKRPEGGTVRISAYERPAYYIVRVEDDGVGFDPSSVLQKDGRSHVGLPNICYRFKTMMHADVDVQSKKGIGTTVTVRIPKAQKEKDQS